MARQRHAKPAASLQSSILSRLKKTQRSSASVGGKSSQTDSTSTQPQSTLPVQRDSISDESPKLQPTSTISASNDDQAPSPPDVNLSPTHKRKRQDDQEYESSSMDQLAKLNSKAKKTELKTAKNKDIQDENPTIAGRIPLPVSKEKKIIIDEGSKLISEFHRIEKTLSQPNLDPLTRHKLKIEQKRLGGLEAYQTASKIGGAIQRGGETGKWCAKTLVQLGLRPSPNPDSPKKIKLLDVGAIDGKSYSKFKNWISTTSIDLNPIDESKVLKYDFFEFPLPQNEDEKFDVVCLSLVLNFVGDLKKRGEMIKRARKFLKIGGNLFIVLPLACVNNSRYLDSSRFEKILNYLGFKLIVQHDSTKLTYWFLENLSQEQQQQVEKEDQNGHDHRVKKDLKSHRNHQKTLKFPKVQIRSGLNRNNFCIKV